MTTAWILAIAGLCGAAYSFTLGIVEPSPWIKRKEKP